MHKDLKKILISNEEITKRTKEMGEQISSDYEGKTPIFLALLKGSVPFMAELIKNVSLYLQTEYMCVQSYHGGTHTTGEVKIVKDIDCSVSGRDVIIVEDIIDSGITLSTIKALIKDRGANSVEIACLVDKKAKRIKEIDVKYVGFEIPDEFVVGYGLDYKELYRNLPYIGVLKEEVYE